MDTVLDIILYIILDTVPDICNKLLFGIIEIHTDPHRPTPSHTEPEKCFKYAHRPTPTLKNALNTHTDPHRPGVALRLTQKRLKLHQTITEVT